MRRDGSVLERIASQPKAKEIFGSEFPQPSVKELRKEMGLEPEVSDEEFLLRFVLTQKGVDEMLAAGPIKTI